MIKRFLLGSAVVALTAGAASAADPVIYDPAPAPLPVASMFDWSGFYVGANAGYGGGTFEHPFAITDGDEIDVIGSIDITSGGGVAGVQAGYNWQMNQWIFGAETDLQWSGIKGEAGLTIGDGVDSISLAAGTEVEWFGTIRARLGYTPIDRFMVYATGGAAYGKVNSYIEFGDDGISTDDTEWGWTVGAGAEYAMTDRLSLKTEYLYTDLGPRNLAAGEIFDGIDGSLDSDVKFHTVRVGLNFHF